MKTEKFGTAKAPQIATASGGSGARSTTIPDAGFCHHGLAATQHKPTSRPPELFCQAEPTSDGLQPTSDGLQHSSDDRSL